MKKPIVILLISVILLSCGVNEKSEVKIADGGIIESKSDGLYHYSIWWAFVNLVFDGTLRADELKEKGDIALGSYNALEGELVMVDGKLFKVTEDGVVNEAEDDDLICYANATWFDNDKSFKLENVASYEELRKSLNENLPNLRQFYGFRIKGNFKYMKCGGVPPQEKPYTEGLDVLLPKRPIFEKENLSGTMVGFFSPDFIGNINAMGYHLHFISDDETFGGHVLEFNADDLNIEIDLISEYTFVLPETDEYLKGTFEKEFQYGKK